MITVEPDILGINDGDITLDAGCGDGRHSWEVYNRRHSPIVAFDIDTTCVKKNKYMLDSLKEQRQIRDDYHLLVANVTKLPFKDGSFDKIICSEVLEHIAEDRIAVEELIRVLRKDGAIGISVPHHLAESICWKLSKEYYGFPGGHIRNYRTRQLLDLVDAVGLSVYSIRHKHALHSFYWMLRCIFGVKKEKAPVPALYNRFLEWDLRANHSFFRWVEGLLNRICPKSLVIYARKKEFAAPQYYHVTRLPRFLRYELAVQGRRNLSSQPQFLLPQVCDGRGSIPLSPAGRFCQLQTIGRRQ